MVIDCPNCGNPIDAEFYYCKWCERRIEVRPKKTEGKIKTINLEDGYPTIDQARRRLHREIRNTTNTKTVLKVIHGYGSSGQGGEIIRAALVKTLNRLLREDKIKCYSMGLDHEMSFNQIKSLLNSDRDSKNEIARKIKVDLNNPGVTFVFR